MLREIKETTYLKRIILLLESTLMIVQISNQTTFQSTTKTKILFDQMFDSIIVAGITGLSAYIYSGQDCSLKAAALSFVLTFLVKMKEYRKIAA